jgi:hypothetical protein
MAVRNVVKEILCLMLGRKQSGEGRVKEKEQYPGALV